MQQQKGGSGGGWQQKGGWNSGPHVQKPWLKQNRQKGGWRPGNPQTMIWVGNIAEGTTNQDLKAQAEQVGPAKWAEVFFQRGKGTGAVGFASPSDVGPAAAALNGAWLNGSRLQVDVWEKKDGGGKGGSQGWTPPQQQWQPQQSYQQQSYQQQGYQQQKGGGKGWKPGNPKKMIWVGNLAEGTTLQQLKEHAALGGGNVSWAEVWAKKNTGAVGFKTEVDVEPAVAALNGTFLNGKAIQVDVWDKKKD